MKRSQEKYGGEASLHGKCLLTSVCVSGRVCCSVVSSAFFIPIFAASTTNIVGYSSVALRHDTQLRYSKEYILILAYRTTVTLLYPGRVCYLMKYVILVCQ